MNARPQAIVVAVLFAACTTAKPGADSAVADSVHTGAAPSRAVSTMPLDSAMAAGASAPAQDSLGSAPKVRSTRPVPPRHATTATAPPDSVKLKQPAASDSNRIIGYDRALHRKTINLPVVPPKP